MLVDIHTHAFHPKIAHKAVERLNEHYHVHCAGEGTIEDLAIRERNADIDHFVVLCAATDPGQVIPANTYAISLQRENANITAFGTIHPGYELWEEQLARVKKAGLKGLKLHPDFQNFRLDDPRLLPIFEAAQDDFIFQIHIGDLLPPDQNPSCPYKLAAILDNFPRLKVIAAHLGGYRMWEHALKVLAGRDLWLETSSTTPFISDEMLCALMNSHPRERLLFGSDYPLYDPLDEKERLQRRARLSDAQLERIMGNGADLLFG